MRFKKEIIVLIKIVKGARKGKIPKGTKFEDLPDDWTCPICGAGKEDFEKE